MATTYAVIVDLATGQNNRPISPTVPAMDNSTCLLGSPASHLIRLSVCSLSALLNCVVLAAVFRSSNQAKGFSLLVAIDVFMNLCLSARSAMAFVADTVTHSNQSSHPHCRYYLKWFTTAWKVSYLARSWWIVAMTSARYTVVVRPLSAPIEFNYRQQAGLLCGLSALSAAFTIAMDLITTSVIHEHIFDLTISIEVVLSTGVPIIVVMTLTCIMSNHLIRRRRLWTDLPANVDSNLKATKTLLLVSGSFFGLSFPHLFYELGCSIGNLSSAMPLSSSGMPEWLNILGEIKSLLISVDSGLNFAIYFVMCRNFRIQLLGFLHIRMSCLQPKVNNRKVSCGLRCVSNDSHHPSGRHQRSNVCKDDADAIRPLRCVVEDSVSACGSVVVADPVSSSHSGPPHSSHMDSGYV